MGMAKRTASQSKFSAANLALYICCQIDRVQTRVEARQINCLARLGGQRILPSSSQRRCRALLTAGSQIFVTFLKTERGSDMARITTLSSFVVAIGMVASAGLAHAQAVALEVDQTRPLRFDVPVTGVVVGNSSIADVIVHDPRTLFLIGKSVGTTQVLAVDQRGRTVYSGQVAVRAPTINNLVTVQRGREIGSSICDERCIAFPDAESTQTSMADAVSRARTRSSFAGGRN
jgi:hypothetical protein